MDKDPAAKLDYVVDWSAWLAASGDTITTSTWTVPTGLTKVTDSVSGGKAIVWLTGGTVGQVYPVTNHIVTGNGREDERTLTIVVVDR